MGVSGFIHKLAILALKAFSSDNKKTPVTEKLPTVAFNEKDTATEKLPPVAFDPPISGLSIQQSIHWHVVNAIIDFLVLDDLGRIIKAWLFKGSENLRYTCYVWLSQHT